MGNLSADSSATSIEQVDRAQLPEPLRRGEPNSLDTGIDPGARLGIELLDPGVPGGE